MHAPYRLVQGVLSERGIGKRNLIRRTAGKSIVNALSPQASGQHHLCPPKGFPHETVDEFVARVGEDIFRRYCSFCIVRHPLDRFFSQYRYLKMRERKIPYMKGIPDIVAFISAIERDDEVLVKLKGNNGKIERLSSLMRSQTSYVSLNGDPAISRTFRFEELPNRGRRYAPQSEPS